MSELPPERKPDKLSIRDKAAEAAPDMPGGSRTFFYARHWRPSPTASFTTAKWLYCSIVPQHHTIVKDWGYPSLLLWQGFVDAVHNNVIDNENSIQEKLAVTTF